MAEADPRRAPLDGRVPWQSPSGAVTLDELRFARQIVLRLRARAAAYLAGLPLPLEANRVAAMGPVHSLWLGPDEFLVTAPDGAVPELLPRLVRAAGPDAAIVDVSSSHVVMLVAGYAARTLLEKGCRLDLHPRVFAAGHCAQTLFAGVPVILEQTAAAPSYRLFVRRSTARWLFDWLVEAAE
jgi:sarcosine oxidase subunit gamma